MRPWIKAGADDITLETPLGNLSGSFAVEKTTSPDGPTQILIAAAGVDLFVGSDSEEIGVRVSGAELMVLIAPGGYAFEAGGLASVVGIDGVTLSGDLGMQKNTFSDAVLRGITVGNITKTLDLAAGTSRFGGENVKLEMLGQTIGGNFSIVKNGSDVEIHISDAHIGLGDGTKDFVSVTIESGSLAMSSSGIAGTLTQAQIEVDLPGIEFAGIFNAEIDTAAQYFRIAGGEISADENDLAVLTIAGQTLKGVFVIEGLTAGDNQKIVRVAATGVSVSLASDSVGITNAHGALVIMETGIAGMIGGDFYISITGLTTDASFDVEINTSAAAVSESFSLPGTDDILLDLPAGPYIKVVGKNVAVNIGEADALALTGTFGFEQQTTDNGAGTLETVTTLAVLDGSFTFDGNGVKNADGAFVVTPGGIAGIISGEISIAAGDDFGVGGSLGLRINSTLSAVDVNVEIDGSLIHVGFGENETASGSAGGITPFFQIFGADMSLRIADFISVEGSFSYTSASDYQWFAGFGLEIFIGQGPARLNGGEINPAAAGVLLFDAAVGMINYSESRFALYATGTVAIIGVDGITISGTARVRINNSGLAVDELLEIPGTDSDVAVFFSTGDLVKSFQATNMELTVLGQTLTGNFGFGVLTLDPDGTPGNEDDSRVIEISADSVSLSLGQAGGSSLDVTDGQGTFIYTSDGLTGVLSAFVAADIPGVEFQGAMGIGINTTGSEVTFTTGNDVDVTLAAGPFLRITGTDIELDILGQTLSGSFIFEMAAADGGGSIIRVGAMDVEIFIGDDQNTADESDDFGVRARCDGIFIITGSGIAGRLSGSISLSNVSGIDFGSDIQLAVNTTDSPVLETMTAGSRSVVLDLSGGPYIRLEAVDFDLVIFDQAIHGDFAFESVINDTGEQLVRVAAENISFALSDGSTDLVSLSNGQGSFLLTPEGLAGEISGIVTITIPGIDVSGIFSLQINQTTAAVNELFTAGDSSIYLNLPVGPYLKISGEDVSISILGQTISGDFAFIKNGDVIELALSNAYVGFGDGTTDFISAAIASGNLSISSAGVTGEIAGAELSANIPDLSFSGTFALEIDTVSADKFVRIEGVGVSLEIAGQSLGGNFTFESITTAGGERVVRLGASALNLTLGDPASPFVAITGGSGAMIISSSGVAAGFSIDPVFNVPGVSISGGTVSFEINTTPAPVNETFQIGSETITLNLAAGSFVRVAIIGAQITIGAGSPAISGNFYFDQRLDENDDKITRMAVSDVTVAIGDQSLTDGEGGFVVSSAGVAGVVSGSASLDAGVADASGNIILRVNKTGGAVDETIDINGRSIVIRFGESEGDIFSFSISDLSLNIADFISIEGNISFVENGNRLVFAGDELMIFMGSGPAKLDNGDINPLASGVLLSDAKIGLIKITQAQGDTFALYATGSVALIGIDGITISGTASVRVNTTGTAINETLSIPGSNDEGVPVTFDSGDQVLSLQVADTELCLFGQSLAGDFSFDKITSGDMAGTLRVAANDVSMSMGDGSTDLVSITQGSGSFIFTGSGIAGSVSAAITENIPGVDFAGTFALEINTTHAAVNQIFVFGEEQLVMDIRAGPFMRIAGQDVSLELMGQTLSGDFAFEQLTSPAGGSIVKLAADNVSFSLTAGSNDILSLTEAQGMFVISDSGLAGRLEGTVTMEIPGGINFAGNLSLAVNTSTFAVHEQFLVDSNVLELILPSGPYLRFEGTGLQLEVFGQSLSGDFSFEQTVTSDPEPVKIVKIAAANVTLSLKNGSDDLVTVTHGTGALFITDAGLAGELSGSVAVHIPDVAVSGTLNLQINTTGVDVHETIMAGSIPVALELPAGPYVRLAGTDVSLSISGQTLTGDFVFEQVTENADTLVRARAENVAISLGGTTPVISLSNGYGFFEISSAGLMGGLSTDLAVNLSGISLSGRFTVLVNTTAAAGDIQLLPDAEPAALLAGPYFKVAVTGVDDTTRASLSLLGQTLEGNFVIEQVTGADGQAVVRVAASDVEISLADGIVSVTDGQGFFVFTGAGAAGTLSAGVSVDAGDDVSFSGDFTLKINTTDAAVSEIIQAGSGTLTLELDAGPYLLIAGDSVLLSVFGQTLSGNFAFEQSTRDSGEKVVKISAGQVAMNIGSGILTVGSGHGNFVIDSTGIAGSLGCSASLNIPGIVVSGILDVEINTTGHIVNETFITGDVEETLDLPAGPYVRVAGDSIVLSVGGVLLTGGFVFEQSTSSGLSTAVRVSFADVELKVGEGDNSIIQVTNGQGAFEIIKIFENGVVVEKGLYGYLSGSVGVNVPGVDFDGSFQVKINTTGSEKTIDEILIEDGFFIEGTNIDIDIAGQSIVCESLAIEIEDTPQGTRLTLRVTDFELKLGSDSDPFVLVTSSSAVFVIDSLGIAASFDVTLDILNIPGVTVSGGITRVEINTRPLPFDLDDDGDIDENDLAGGSFVRVSVVELTLSVGGVSFSGNFFFDQTTNADNVKITRFAMSDVSFDYSDGDNFEISQGQGAFVIYSDGIAGFVSGQLSLGIGGCDAGAGVKLRLNSTSHTVYEEIQLNGQSLTIEFGDGEIADPSTFFNFIISGASINIGDFVIIEGDEINITGGSFSGSGISVFMGQGPVKLEDGSINPDARGVLLDNANIGLIRSGSGPYTYALYAEGEVMILGIPGVSFSGSAVVQYSDISGETIVSVPDGNGGSVDHTINYGARRFEATIDLDILGQVLSGTFLFEKGADDPATPGKNEAGDIKIAVAGASLSLNDGNSNLVTIEDISGALLISGDGLAGEVSVDIQSLEVGPVSFSGAIGIAINNTNNQINETFILGHDPAIDTDDETIILDLPAGPYFRLSITGSGT
ncbi:MAG: hypothetical protein B6I22_01165, partial [Desulfobacteraceae bacterium 4572_123]